MTRPNGATTMRAAKPSPCEPAVLAAAVRTLARDAHSALHGPHTEASLAELARRAEDLKACLEGHPSAPLRSWLNGLAMILEHAQTEECSRGHLPFRRDATGSSPARIRMCPTGHLSGLRRETA